MPIFRKVDKRFFKRWSTDMSYVLGFFAADGNLSINNRGGCYIAFHSKDVEIIKSVKIAMKSNHKISDRLNTKTDTILYRLQIGSAEIVNDLLRLGYGQNKTKHLPFPNIPKNLLPHFIRGYFDGDGNIWVGLINKNRIKPIKIIQTAFTSGSQIFLKHLHETLISLGITGGSIFKVKNKNCYRLLLSKNDSLKLYKIMYNTNSKLYLRRKKLVFKGFIKNAAVAQFG